jgi:hypothetical protein
MERQVNGGGNFALFKVGDGTIEHFQGPGGNRIGWHQDPRFQHVGTIGKRFDMKVFCFRATQTDAVFCVRRHIVVIDDGDFLRDFR